jgi:hypothetical protein
MINKKHISYSLLVKKYPIISRENRLLKIQNKNLTNDNEFLISQNKELKLLLQAKIGRYSSEKVVKEDKRIQKRTTNNL